ncbi:MAG: glutamate formimidoyltransferase [Rectinemataceae bacterium]
MSERIMVECVPNFSEGRDSRIIDAISSAVRSSEGVSLLDVDPGAGTNRTVYTFVGGPEEVLRAALAAARTARALIDMRRHSGAHPRMGALDVCPFIPVSGIGMEECAELSRRFGSALAAELGVPVYLYEKAASRPSRTSLADIRSGEYEGLAAKLADPEWAPDFGPAVFDPRWGATVTGAREFLVAYNVNLNTRDKKLANEVALNIREAGRAARAADGTMLKDSDGKAINVPGRLKAVRAIGWYIEEYRRAQVSINLTDYRTTPLHVVYETAKEEAEKLGLFVTGSELVGLAPLDVFRETGRHFLEKAGKSPGLSDRELVEIAVQSLGLDSVAPFEPERKVVEWAASVPGKLVSMKTRDFVDEVASDSPAPGGGSVAALAGAMGAALAAMVGNLTVGKKGYEGQAAVLSGMAIGAQDLKESLIRAVDEDTAAFDALMEASRLPKSTEAQKAARAARMREAGEGAILVPMATARSCFSALEACVAAARHGNRNSVSDAGVGALMARAGLEGALLNVRINLASLGDADWAAALGAEAASLSERAGALEAEALAAADATISTL